MPAIRVRPVCKLFARLLDRLLARILARLLARLLAPLLGRLLPDGFSTYPLAFIARPLSPAGSSRLFARLFYYRHKKFAHRVLTNSLSGETSDADRRREKTRRC